MSPVVFSARDGGTKDGNCLCVGFGFITDSGLSSFAAFSVLGKKIIGKDSSTVGMT